MAAFTLDAAPITRDFGRSGYNKDDESTKGNKGRVLCQRRPEASSKTSFFGGRGAHSRGDDKGGQDSGRSGYN